MKKLPTGRQNFAGIIEEGLLYIDKTQQVYDLVSNGKLYFLSRPRRFGKSLLVSTFAHLFSGNKELFQELYIGKETNYEWTGFPVLQFNFATYGHGVEDLTLAIKGDLQRYAEEYEVEISGMN
ncbi:MAG: AAA family ATPase, partial [Bacteroidetes bacterium]|nr:AAA family ATPase [Bacteroidota bacterium]